MHTLKTHALGGFVALSALTLSALTLAGCDDEATTDARPSADMGVVADGAVTDGGLGDASAPDAAPWESPPDAGPLPPPPSSQLGIWRVVADGDVTSAVCADCHSSAPSSNALRDAQGRSVAPYDLWQGSMMANSARDPFWKAMVAAEVAHFPEAAGEIEATCMRCHAPLAEGASGPEQANMAMLEQGDDRGALSRDGVACGTCHRLDPDTLVPPESFSGNFEMSRFAVVYGPYEEDLFVNPMLAHTGMRPTYGAHVATSELCATCHTLYTDTLDGAGAPTGDRLPEQTPYLEWQASSYSEAEITCQGCHLPRLDEDGEMIDAIIARRPDGGDFGLQPRTPFGRHVFLGGNATMLSLLAKFRDRLRSPASSEALEKTRELTLQNLTQHTAALEIAEAGREGDTLRLAVAVQHDVGHKLPTGFPSRRAWLHVTVRDAAGAVIFESGAHDGRGRIVGRGGVHPSEWPGGPIRPHMDTIADPDDVQIYESVMADSEGAPTVSVLAAARYLKDNRLLPKGWQGDHPSAVDIQPIGVDGDDSFTGGGDVVTYAVQAPAAAGPYTVEAALQFQSLSPRFIAELLMVEVEAVRDFEFYWRQIDPSPTTLATATLTAP